MLDRHVYEDDELRSIVEDHMEVLVKIGYEPDGNDGWVDAYNMIIDLDLLDMDKEEYQDYLKFLD